MMGEDEQRQTAWPDEVERIGAFLRATGAEARLEEFAEPVGDVEDAAEAIGCELCQVVVALVFSSDAGPAVALLPGDRRVDPHKVAAALGTQVARAEHGERERNLTGFPPGFVAPFPLPDEVAVLAERTLVSLPRIWVCAASAFHLVALAPVELVRLARARTVDLVAEHA